MVRKVFFVLVAGGLVWSGAAVPSRLLLATLLFWQAAFIRDEMISLALLVVATVGGLLAWGWSLHKRRAGGRN